MKLFSQCCRQRALIQYKVWAQSMGTCDTNLVFISLTILTAPSDVTFVCLHACSVRRAETHLGPDGTRFEQNAQARLINTKSFNIDEEYPKRVKILII